MKNFFANHTNDLAATAADLQHNSDLSRIKNSATKEK